MLFIGGLVISLLLLTGFWTTRPQALAQATPLADPIAPTAAATLPPTATATPLPPTATVQPSATPLPSLTPTPTATPPCSAPGTVQQINIESDLLNYAMDMTLYLPPCYATHDLTRRYPVLYLVHGLEQTDQFWIELGLPEVLDDLILSGEVPPFIVAMPREYRDDRFDQAMVTDIIPYVDRNYRTLAGRAYRAVGGLSRGGAFTARIAFQHPDLFAAAGFHSPAIFFADEQRIGGWLNTVGADEWPAIWIDIGDLDGLIVSAGWLHTALERRAVPHEYTIFPGAHNDTYWRFHLEDYLRWYASHWPELARR